MIGRLLGHSELQATERYAHLDRDWVRDAAVRISESIAADVLKGYPGQKAKLMVLSAHGANEEVVMNDFPASRARFGARSPRAA